MHPEQFLIPLTIASLILPTYIFIRAFQLRLIKSDFHVLGKKKKKKIRFHNSDVYGISYGISSRKEAVFRGTKRFGIRRVDY